MCCCGPKQQRMERRILLKSLINVFHKTDIFSVFNKIRNIDIMLFLLLNDKQRQLVDYIQREQIVFNNKNEQVNYYAKYINNYTLIFLFINYCLMEQYWATFLKKDKKIIAVNKMVAAIYIK